MYLIKKVCLIFSSVLFVSYSIVALAETPANSSDTTALKVIPQIAVPTKPPSDKVLSVASTTPVTTTPATAGDATAEPITNMVHARATQEAKVQPNSFAFVSNKPSYLLPYYFTGSPDNSVYHGKYPAGSSLKHNEIKYQISFKLPVWRNILNYPSTLYVGYTQLSYWQAYNKTAFFRETDYQPELFLANEINYHLPLKWRFNFINIGLVHQSNGLGGALERSWNRAYLAGIMSNDRWVISLKPWIIFQDSTYKRQNPNMAMFLGYGDIVVAYKYGNQVLAVETHNVIESGGRRSGTTLSWSFPLTPYIKGYVQGFSGYGQSLIEYNHRTSSVGIGFAISNWV